MNSLWTSKPSQGAAEPTEPANPTSDVAEKEDGEEVNQQSAAINAAIAAAAAGQTTNPNSAAPPPSRPILQRNAMQSGLAAPINPQVNPRQQYQQQQQSQQMPPQHGPSDSLSLMQLRRIVAEVHRADPAAYDFVYSDMSPHAEEIDEWFMYQFWQWVRLNAAQKAFEWHWNHESGGKDAWDDAEHDTRATFVQTAIAGVQSNDAALRSASIGKLMYLVLGRWGDTAMPHATDATSRSIASLPQLQAIKAGVECLTSLEGLPVIWGALRTSFEAHWYVHISMQELKSVWRSLLLTGVFFTYNNRSGDIPQGSAQEAQDELINLMTIMYIAIQETLSDPEDMSSSYAKLRRFRHLLFFFFFFFSLDTALTSVI